MHIRSHVTRNIIKRAASRFRFEGVFCSPSRKKHLRAQRRRSMLYAPLIEPARDTRARTKVAATPAISKEGLINFNKCAPLKGFDWWVLLLWPHHERKIFKNKYTLSEGFITKYWFWLKNPWSFSVKIFVMDAYLITLLTCSEKIGFNLDAPNLISKLYVNMIINNQH